MNIVFRLIAKKNFQNNQQIFVFCCSFDKHDEQNNLTKFGCENITYASCVILPDDVPPKLIFFRGTGN